MYRIFAAALFVIAEDYNRPQYLIEGDQLNNLGFSYNKDYSVAIKKNEVALL